eukprot:4477618-Prymnesium_polylepis.1
MGVAELAAATVVAMKVVEKEATGMAVRMAVVDWEVAKAEASTVVVTVVDSTAEEVRARVAKAVVWGAVKVVAMAAFGTW